MAAAAALAVQQVIERDRLLDRVPARRYLEPRLREVLGGHPHVGDIRGRGFFRGVELVEDRATKRPFDPALKLNARSRRTRWSAACSTRWAAPSMARRATTSCSPPFISIEADLDEIVERLAEAIDTGTAALRRAA